MTPLVSRPGERAARAAAPFLTARWENLLLFTFEAPENLVRSVLHPALEPDRWEGRTYVSLVAFDFRDTRVKGWRVPGFTDFPEVNLRTYARHGDRRGVVFVRELVPARLVALLARLRYNEPYRAMAMSSEARITNDRVRIRHILGRRATHTIGAVGSAVASIPSTLSAAHHFKEHAWGFGTSRNGTLLRYRVEHPVWAVRELEEITVRVDFAALYGPQWAFLGRSPPAFTTFAVGSDVEVFPPERIGRT